LGHFYRARVGHFYPALIAKLDNTLVIGSYILHDRPLETSFSLFFGLGYTYLGCVIAGCLAGAVYLHLNRLSWLRAFDSLYSLAFAYALGRIGCFLAGDGDYGTPSSLPWAVPFPHGIVPALVRVHPTVLYSSVWELLVFAALCYLDRQRPRPSVLFGLYLMPPR
jgi:phosphatidylglycerol:prolipoprotein diacylglycerol transferase